MRRSLLVLALLLVCAIACEKSVVYGDLNQSDANEILVLLTKHGVQVSLKREVRQNQIYYSIVVNPDELDRARALLDENNLPRKKKPGLADIFAQPGFIPTPEEQKARYLLALRGEIINSLEHIPDVVEANVIINVPSPEGLDAKDVPQKPTASVVLKVRPTEQSVATLTEAKVQRFVANSVEKLDPRDVAVIITYTVLPASGMPGQGVVLSPEAQRGPGKETKVHPPVDGESVSVAGLSVSPESAGKLKLYLGLFLGLLALLSVGLVAMVVQATRMRQEMRDIREHPALESGAPDQEPPQLQAGGDEE